MLFAESTGLRSPSLSSPGDMGRVKKRLTDWSEGAKQVQENLWVLSPLGFPASWGMPFRAISEQWVGRTIRNAADQLIYQVENTLSENGEKLTDEDRKPIEEAMAETKTALGKGDVAEINAACERLQKASHRLAEVMYKTNADTAAGPADEGASAGPASADDVIDAEVVEDGKSG